MTRPDAIPPLAKWLAEHVTETRAESFDDWAAFTDYAERTLAMKACDAKTADETMTLRICKTLAVAFVETLRAEDKSAETAARASQLLARVVGMMCFNAVVSPLDHIDKPLRLAKLLTDEFGQGAKLAARQYRQVAP